MQGSLRAFRPSLSSSLATGIGIALFVSLGFWQLDRAGQKREIFDRLSARLDEAEIRAAAGLSQQDATGRRVQLVGSFDDDFIVLLDNQVDSGQAGYLVLTPFRLAAGGAILASHGWIAAGDRRRVPTLNISGSDELRGVLWSPPAAGIKLNSESETIEHLTDRVLRVQRVDFSALEGHYGTDLYDMLVYRDAGSDAFRRVLPAPTDRGERHEAYALQWFLFAAIALVLFILLNWRRGASP